MNRAHYLTQTRRTSTYLFHHDKPCLASSARTHRAPLSGRHASLPAHRSAHPSAHVSAKPKMVAVLDVDDEKVLSAEQACRSGQPQVSMCSMGAWTRASRRGLGACAPCWMSSLPTLTHPPFLFHRSTCSGACESHTSIEELRLRCDGGTPESLESDSALPHHSSLPEHRTLH